MAVDFVVSIVAFAAIVVVVAFLSGILSQLTRFPKLVFYLFAGLLIGPLGFAIITQDMVLVMGGSLLQAVVGLAVALIVFEGGYYFNRCLPSEKACTIIPLRQLLKRLLRLSLIGGLITGLLMMFLFHYIALLPLPYAALCGVLCIITGPTVINPCIRQLRIKEDVGVVLEGEGLVNDALGVIVASTIFGVILAESLGTVIPWPMEVALNLGLGAIVGLIVGGLGVFIARFVTPRFLVRVGERCDESNRAQLTRIGTLIAAFLSYLAGELVATEAGIIAALIAGILIGNRHRFGQNNDDSKYSSPDTFGLAEHIEEGVHSFQSDLTTIAIAAVFILLTAIVTREILIGTLIGASVPFAGLLIVGALMMLVRPFSILVATIRSGFTIRERLFMSFFGPRGIVIAATAVFVYIELLAHGIDVPVIPSYIFLIVLATVLFQAGLSPLTANLFRVRSPKTQNAGTTAA